MFLIQCYDDNCAYIIDNDDIQHDNKKPHELVKDDITKFNMKKRQYEGKVIDFSSNSEFLQKRRQDFNKTIKQKKKVTAGVNRSKRIPMPKRSWSPENSPPPKKLKTLKNLSSSHKIHFENETEKLHSQSSYETKLKTTLKIKKSTKVSENSESSSSSNISEESLDKNYDSFLPSNFDETPSRHEENISPSKEELKKQLAMLLAEKQNNLLPQSSENDKQVSNAVLNSNKDPECDSDHEIIPKHDKKNSRSDGLTIQKSSRAALVPKNVNVIDLKQLELEEGKINDGKVSYVFSEAIKKNSDQLFPPDYDSANMKNIGNNVYCRKIIYDSALGASHKPTHLARRLLEGVFNHDAMMGCTLTGQAPRTKDKKSAVVNPLDQQAKDAIVEFAMQTAVERKWPIQSRQIILKEMSQKLTEYKRDNMKKVSAAETSPKN